MNTTDLLIASIKSAIVVTLVSFTKLNRASISVSKFMISSKVLILLFTKVAKAKEIISLITSTSACQSVTAPKLKSSIVIGISSVKIIPNTKLANSAAWPSKIFKPNNLSRISWNKLASGITISQSKFALQYSTKLLLLTMISKMSTNDCKSCASCSPVRLSPQKSSITSFSSSILITPWNPIGKMCSIVCKVRTWVKISIILLRFSVVTYEVFLNPSVSMNSIILSLEVSSFTTSNSIIEATIPFAISPSSPQLISSKSSGLTIGRSIVPASLSPAKLIPHAKISWPLPWNICISKKASIILLTLSRISVTSTGLPTITYWIFISTNSWAMYMMCLKSAASSAPVASLNSSISTNSAKSAGIIPATYWSWIAGNNVSINIEPFVSTNWPFSSLEYVPIRIANASTICLKLSCSVIYSKSILICPFSSINTNSGSCKIWANSSKKPINFSCSPS